MSGMKEAKNSDRARIFETVLSSPGMNETCKIVLTPSRQTIVLLSRLIEQGLERGEQENADDIFPFLPVGALNDLKSIMEELLKKGGLTDFYERLKVL